MKQGSSDRNTLQLLGKYWGGMLKELARLPASLSTILPTRNTPDPNPLVPGTLHFQKQYENPALASAILGIFRSINFAQF